jgi:hypothetical protein
MAKPRVGMGGVRIGDRVRIVRLPAVWDEPDYKVGRDTRAPYRLLIRRGRGMRVYEIDEWKAPWVRCHTRGRNGLPVHHWLGLYEEDSWVKVVPRGPKTPSRQSRKG